MTLIPVVASTLFISFLITRFVVTVLNYPGEHARIPGPTPNHLTFMHDGWWLAIKFEDYKKWAETRYHRDERREFPPSIWLLTREHYFQKPDWREYRFIDEEHYANSDLEVESVSIHDLLVEQNLVISQKERARKRAQAAKAVWQKN